MNSEELFEKYDKLGLEIVSDGNPAQIVEVYLDCFSSEEWVEIVNKEGELLGSCCATISEIRDTLIDVLRNNYSISTCDLHDIVETLNYHNGECETENCVVQLRLSDLWEKIKEDSKLEERICKVDPTNIKDAFSILYQSSAVMAWNFLNKSGEDGQFNHDSIRYQEFIKILPAIKTIYNSIVDSKFEPFEGFAICDGAEMLKLRSGVFLFPTYDKAKKIVDEIEQIKNNKKYTIRSVKLSLDNGTQFKD